MRTTLDIDNDVLETVKELARAERKPAGKVLSELARIALTTPTGAAETTGPAGAVLRKGWYVLPKRGGGIVTNELVDRLLEEADLEDAGIIESQ
jgi:hypothetical protein